MSNLKIEVYLKLIFIISLISVFSAYFIQYILGHQPCNLCLLERIPYILSIILIVINYILKKNEKFFILLLIIVFIFSFTISVYHFGIEQGIFEESLICSIENNSTIISKEELLLELQRNSVSCKDVTFRIFGLSLTSINIIISLIILSFLIKIFIFYEEIR